MDVYDCAERYAGDNVSLILIAGKDYGSGSSRDWAAKGPYLLVSVSLVFAIKEKPNYKEFSAKTQKHPKNYKRNMKIIKNVKCVCIQVAHILLNVSLAFYF